MTRLPTLAAIIEEAKRVNDWSDRDIMERAARADLILTKSDISAFRTIGMAHINPDKVLALAAGMSMPAHAIATAILSDFGIDIPQAVSTPEAAIERDFTLSLKSRQWLLTILAQERSS